MHRVLDRQRGNQIPVGRCALAIMTKAPRAGTVKTRLQPPLTAPEAAELNICFLRDIAAAISETGEHSQGIGVFTPARSEREYEGILPSHFDLIPQRGNGFGERLTNAVDDLLHVGFEYFSFIVVIGSFFVVTGGKDVPLDYSILSAVDLPGKKKAGDLRFESAHVEAMALLLNELSLAVYEASELLHGDGPVRGIGIDLLSFGR
jgi:hypothetical protein